MADFTIEHLEPESLAPHPRNFRRHPDSQKFALSASIEEHGWLAAPIWNKRTERLLDGHARVELALGREERIPVRVIDVPEEQERRILRAFDRIGAMALEDTEALDSLIAEIGDSDLERLLGELTLPESGLLPDEVEGDATARLTLAERFGVPPFSVLDARQGYWQERKRAWIAIGIESELGRGEATRPGSPGDKRPAVTREGKYSGGDAYRYAGPNRSDYSRSGAVVENGPGGLVQRLAAARGYNAAPGGTPRDAASLGKDGKTVRGDGKGRRITPGQQGGKTDLWSSSGQAQRERYEGRADFGTPGMAYDGGPMPEDAPAAASGTSIFDPVLCELAYRWFCPEGGRVLDPFAGGSVRGIVATTLKRQYVGIDLSERQIAANREQAERIGVTPEWIVGDSRNMETLTAGEFDFIFSCPPYADLEVYSDDPADLSTLDYPEFLIAYRQIIAGAVERLKADRFACFVVGDVRDPKGFYRNFVADTVAAFQDAGAKLYNEAILVTAVGSLPIRVGKQFGSYRKLGKTHQNVVVFYKGDPRRIPDIAGECEFGELTDDSAPV